jgi:hypothetical protein
MLSTLSATDTRGLCLNIIHVSISYYTYVYLPNDRRVRGIYLLDCMDQSHRHSILTYFGASNRHLFTPALATRSGVASLWHIFAPAFAIRSGVVPRIDTPSLQRWQHARGLQSKFPDSGGNIPIRMPYGKYEGKSTVRNTRWPGIRIKRALPSNFPYLRYEVCTDGRISCLTMNWASTR